MAITTDDFNKIWASASPLTPYSFSASQYKEGWNFIGGTPPSRQMWDFLQKQNDEKSQYLLNNFDNYLPLTGGTMTGSIQYVNNGKVFRIAKSDDGYVALNWDWDRRDGAGLTLRSADYSRPGEFTLFARDSNNSCSLEGKPDGSLTWKGQPLLPVGIVQAFAGTTIPSGWLLCDGSAVSRTTYASLYAVIGTTYGAGNGSTTFNLPNLVNKFVEGSATAGTVKSAGLPNITGSMFSFLTGGANQNQGALYQTTDPGGGTTGDGSGSAYTWRRVNLNASSSNSIYGNSSTVQPPAVTMRYIIKY